MKVRTRVGMEGKSLGMITQIPILWEDSALVAVAKPAGLAVIPGRGETTSLLEILAGQLGLPHRGSTDPRLRIVHRLDKDTTGVMLLAKTIEAQRHLSHQFQNNQVKKEYLAIVAGRPDQDHGEIDAPLGVHPTRRDRMTISRQGRPARTLWQIEQRLGRMALLRCFPQTGKTHQIRVHLQLIGLPLAVDPLYNPPPPGVTPGIFLSQFKRNYRLRFGREERPLIARLTLHANVLRFANLDGQTITVECPPPKDFRATINQLGKV